MFTGIVVGQGRVVGEPAAAPGGGRRMRLALPEELGRRLEIGSSLAVSGVCLTVTELDAATCGVDLSPETLARTTLGALGGGDPVNLEPPLRLCDWLGGHIVQGHVDTTTQVVARRDLGEHRELDFLLPADFAPYLVTKGSVTLDGVSLTVAGLGAGTFRVAAIPHTLAVTTLGARVAGDRLNLEVDVLAKYVVRAVAAYQSGAPDG